MNCRVMTTLMRNGRDRRSGKPVMGHAVLERALLVGTRSADHIRASSHSGCIATGASLCAKNRPHTWLHPNASQKGQIPLAPRAPSIHGPSRRFAATLDVGRSRTEADIRLDCFAPTPRCSRESSKLSSRAPRQCPIPALQTVYRDVAAVRPAGPKSFQLALLAEAASTVRM